MKKKVTLTALLFTFIFATFSADAQIMEGKRLMSLGQYNALSVDLVLTNKSEVEKEWIKYIKEFAQKAKKNAAKKVA